MVSDAQLKASRKWKAKNKARDYYYNSKSRAKNFILKQATAVDLELMREYIAQREQLLKSK